MITEIIKGLSLHLGVPAVGVLYYLKLCRNAELKQYALPLFVLFFVYGGWLMVILTSLFWFWSGMASIGVFFLIFVAPFILGLQAYILRTPETPSLHHAIIRRMSLFYPLISLACIVTMFILAD